MYLPITGKRLIISAVVFSCLGMSGLAQQRPRVAIGENVGPVRSIEEWDVTARSVNGRRRTRPVLSSREFYDRKGNLIVYTVYTDEGGILYGDKNTYDAANRVIEKQTTHSPFVYLPDKQIYIYDDRGNLVENKGFDSSGTHLGGELYTYDAADNLVGQLNYPVGKNMVYSNRHQRLHVYDKQGHQIGEQQYVSNAGEATPDEFGMGYQKEVWLNDKEGRPVVKGYLKADNRIVRVETTEYDSRGNTLREVEREAGGRLLRRISYSYVFDRHGNWVKQIRRESTGDGVGSVFGPLEISYRTIRYYPQPYDQKQ